MCAMQYMMFCKILLSTRSGTRVAEYPARILYPLEFSQLFGSDRWSTRNNTLSTKHWL
nr:unnamed protein product [Callosobruchus analis]